MTILENIKADFIAARKERNAVKAGFYSTLIGEIESTATLVDGVKTVSEENVIKTLKTFEKKADEIIAMGALVDQEFRAKAFTETAWVRTYLPRQLEAADLRKIFEEIDHSNMGLMMKHLKENYAGKYDGKLASEIAKEFL